MILNLKPLLQTGVCERRMNRRVRKNVLLEVCVVSLDYAIAAQRAKADRVELCSDLASGGITPDIRLMEAAREHLRVPVHVLIRPRSGDFFYSAHEFQLMRKDIQNAKQLGMDGVVLALLNREFQIDVARTRELVELAHPLQVTFHRAFDQSHSWRDSLEAVIQTGAHRLLTSGCRAKAAEGLSTLARLVHEAKDRIIVMPGGGITPANVVRVLCATSAHEIHASLLTPALRKVEAPQQSSQIELYYQRVLKVTSLLRPPAWYAGVLTHSASPNRRVRRQNGVLSLSPPRSIEPRRSRPAAPMRVILDIGLSFDRTKRLDQPV